jgi:hypothetical protein
MRRAFHSQNQKKRLEFSHNFSWQGYASDVQLGQSFLTMSARYAASVPYSQQTSLCDVGFVLLGVRSTHAIVT